MCLPPTGLGSVTAVISSPESGVVSTCGVSPGSRYRFGNRDAPHRAVGAHGFHLCVERAHGHCHVTRVARIEGHETEISHVFTRAPDENVFGFENPLPADHMPEVSADFVFFPSIARDQEPSIADVISLDTSHDAH